MSKHISRIGASNLKGRTFDYKLGPVTLLWGANLAGKTSTLDAIRIALLGYHPRLGKRNQDTFRLCSSAQLQVQMQLGEQVITRNWTMQNDSVKYASQPDAQIVPPVLLDAREYFSMPAKEKVRYVWDRVVLGFSDDELLAKVRNCKPSLLMTAASEKELNTLLDEIRTTMQDRDEAKESVQSWMETLIDFLATGKRETEMAIKSMTGLQSAQTQLGSFDAAQSVEKLEGALRVEREALSELKRKAQNFEELKARGQREALEVTNARRLLARASASDPDKDIKAKEARLKELAKSKKPERTVSVIHDSINALEVRVTEKNIERLGNELEQHDSDYEHIIHAKCCPVCDQEGEAWKTSYRKKMNRERTKLLRQIEAQKLDLTAKQNRQEVLTKELSETVAKGKAYEAAQSESLLIAKQLNDLREDKRQRDAARELIEKHKSTDMPMEAEIILNTKEMAAKLAEVTELEQQHRRAIAAKQDEVRREQARQRQQQLNATLEVKKLVLALVHAEMERLVSSVMDTVLRRVDPFIESLLPHRLEYRGGEIGWMNGTAFVGHPALFSGADETIIFSALSIALARESPIKLVMMDELGRLDVPRKNALLKRVKALVADGTLDQVLLVDVSKEDYDDLKGVTVIEV